MNASEHRLARVKIRRHKHWGWGYEDQQPTPDALRQTASLAAEHLGLALGEIESPVALEQVDLRAPRVRPPAALAEICASDDHARASHALGKSYTDVVNGFRGRFAHPPDFVARPREEADVERLLEWCCAERVAAIPFGGGTSVVGGVTADVPDSYNGAIAIDLRALDRVLEVDAVSRSARIQAGATGPGLEAQLGEHGLTLRHFPQSFEYSTLGGWIATRAAGHFATVWTHIEDFVESTRAITPVGVWQSRRLPGSGAGVSPDRMLAGSEGALGLITEAWVRVQPRPEHRRSAGVLFSRFSAGAECVRALGQSGLSPANCRLIDAREAAMTMAGDGTRARCSCSASSRPTTPSRRRCRERLRSAPSTAARCPRTSARAAGRAGARTPSAPGARRSSARRTCATCSWRWACSRRRSRRRSRGSASRAFTSASKRPASRRWARCAARAGASPRASRTSTRTDRPSTSR